MSKGWRLLLLLFCSGVLACGADPRHMVAHAPDYELYRQTRVSPTLERRMKAAWTYLQEYPAGEFREEISEWFRKVDANYYLYAHPSRKRLRAYLEALPDGPQASKARARLAQLERAEAAAARREHRVLERVRQVTDELEAAEAARRNFLDSVAAWVKLLASIESWGEPMHELSHEFKQAFGVQQLEAGCDALHCVKQLNKKYAIPGAGHLSDREAVFDVIITLSGGRVVRAELMGPDLFRRLGEAAQRSAIDADGAQGRIEAIASSRQLVSGVLESDLPEAECHREAVSPVVLWRECHGLSIRVIAALEVGGEDRIVVAPIAKSDTVLGN